MEFGTAAILAGGKSSRMGFDKQLLTVGGKSLFESVCGALRQEFPDILAVTNRPELYAGMDVRVCCDTYRDMGPLAGIHAALGNARSRYVYLLACDMPVISLPYIRHMKGRISETGAMICAARRAGRVEPFNGFYCAELLPDAGRRLEGGSSSLFRFISENHSHIIPEEEAAAYDGGHGMFTNINTQREYESYIEGIEQR